MKLKEAEIEKYKKYLNKAKKIIEGFGEGKSRAAEDSLEVCTKEFKGSVCSKVLPCNSFSSDSDAEKSDEGEREDNRETRGN